MLILKFNKLKKLHFERILNKFNILIKERGVLLLFLMGLAWLTSPSKCSSDSCAYTAILAGLFTFGLMIIVGVFLLNSWYRLVKEENENNATIKDFLILVLISIIYLAQWFLMP